MGQLLGPTARDRSTWRNRPPQSPWSRARGGETDYHHGGRPLPSALATRPPVFDALCSHIDELEQLPSGAVVLAQNELSPIQALAVQLPSGKLLFGTQYHPEFTLSVAAGLIEMRAASLVAEGFGRNCAELIAMARDFRALDAEPERRDLAWRYGIGPEILDPLRRTAEIGKWLREAAKISSS
jgi:GMP synthase (glutamine-hydrolysing)